MKRKITDRMIKRYQLEHIVPMAITTPSILIWIRYFDMTVLKTIGISINVIGLIIWWAAKITLGENWGAGYGKPSVNKLVTTGIYSKIRHPLYVGVNLTLIGLCFIYQKLWFVVIALLIVIYFTHRMFVEDRFLTKALGKRYLQYKKNTWF